MLRVRRACGGEAVKCAHCGAVVERLTERLCADCYFMAWMQSKQAAEFVNTWAAKVGVGT